MLIKLILTDIDDTIMPKGNEHVSARTIAALHAAMDAGLRVGPCSGRGFAQMLPFFCGDKRCLDTCIASNGAQVFLDGNPVREACFDPASLRRVVDFASGLPGVGAMYFDGATPVLLAGSREVLRACYPAYADPLVTDGERPMPLPAHPVTKANVFANVDDEATRGLVDRINREVEGIDADFGLRGYLNLMPTGINKGSAIKVLVDAMGCTLDEVVAFGDGGNDVTMMELVPNSVAVANAVPEVAASARWHVGACKNDAVAEAIEALAAGAWPFAK